MLMKNLWVSSTAMCRYMSLLETLFVFGGHSKIDESLHYCEESLHLCHDFCCQIANRKEVALWGDKRSEWQYSIR